MPRNSNSFFHDDTNNNNGKRPTKEQLAQSARFTKTLEVPENSLVFAVAKPFANPEIFSASESSHVAKCEAQNTVQKLQGLVAVLYFNAWLRLKRDLRGDNKPRKFRQVQLTPMWFWKSAHFFITEQARVAGCLDLLIYSPNDELRRAAWDLGYDRPVTVDMISVQLQLPEKTPASRKPPNQASEDDTKVRTESKTLSACERAAKVMSLTPFEMLTYLIQGGELENVDLDGTAASLQFVRFANFSNLGHYSRYAGLADVEPEEVNPAVVFSPANAALILFSRCCSYISTLDRHLIKTPVEFLHFLFNFGEKPPSPDPVREAHNRRALYASQPVDEVEPGELQRLTTELHDLNIKFRQDAFRYGERAGQFITQETPQLRVHLLTESIRDYLPDLPLTRGDPSNLMRVFSDKRVVRKEVMIQARQEFKEQTVEPALARYPNAHVNRDANVQYTKVKESLLATALAIFTEEYTRQIDECAMVFSKVSDLVFPLQGVMPSLPPFARLGTQDMTETDNVMMAIYDECLKLKLDANSPEGMRLGILVMMASSILFEQDRYLFIVQGGPAGGKTYLMKAIRFLLLRIYGIQTAATEASIKNGSDGILPLFMDEGDIFSGAKQVSVAELLSRKGHYSILEETSSTAMLKATLTSQHIEVKTSEFKNKDDVRVTGLKKSDNCGDWFFTSNLLTQGAKNSAIVSRFSPVPYSILGNLNTWTAFIPPGDKRLKTDTLHRFSMLCVIMYHFRACGLFQPPVSETSHIVVDQVVSSLTQLCSDGFKSLFDITDKSLEGVSLKRAYPKAQIDVIRTNILLANADMLAFVEESESTGDKVADYDRNKAILQRIVHKLHAGVSTPPIEMNDGTSLFTQRDLRHISHVCSVMAYLSAVSAMFNGNAACGNFTQGDFFDRTLLLEHAVEDEVEHVIKGLELCKWFDQRLLDGKLALLALYIKENAERDFKLLPDDKGVITIPEFFTGKRASEERWRYFNHKMAMAFDRPIWDQDAHTIVFLFTFMRVSGFTRPLLHYADFDDESEDTALRIDSRVFLFGELTACFNGAVSAAQNPVTTLTFGSEVAFDVERETYTRVPAAVTLGARYPVSMPNRSLWSRPVTRETLFGWRSETSTNSRDDQPRPLVSMVRSMSLDSNPEPQRKRSAVVFVSGGGDGARKEPPVELTRESLVLLEQIRERNSLVATNFFYRLFRINHEAQPRNQQHSEEVQAALAWFQQTLKMSWTPQQRKAFQSKLVDLRRQITDAISQRVGDVNHISRLEALRFSSLTCRHTISNPLTLMKIRDANGELDYPRMVMFWPPKYTRMEGFAPVPARKVWVSEFIKRCKSGHNLMRTSRLIKETEFQVDLDIRHLEREHRLELLTGIPSHLYCLSRNNKKERNGFIARINALVTQLRPILEFQAPFLNEDDDSFHFTEVMPPETAAENRLGPLVTYRDDRKEIAQTSVAVGVFKGLLVDALVEFAKFMSWWNQRMGLLVRMVDRETCHTWARDLGLSFCSRVINQVAQSIWNPDMDDFKALAVKWVDEVVCEFKDQRDERWNQLIEDELYCSALEQRGLFVPDVRSSVFLPSRQDFPLTNEEIMQEFGLYPVLKPKLC